MSRESGWYRVFNKTTGEYEFAYYKIGDLYKHGQWLFLGVTVYHDMIHKYYDIPDDQTPVNPVPADEVKLRHVVQCETGRIGNTYWMDVEDCKTIKEAIDLANEFLENNACINYRAAIVTTEIRVINSSEVE